MGILTGAMKAQAEAMRDRTLISGLFDIVRDSLQTSDYGESASPSVLASGVPLRFRPMTADELPEALRTLTKRVWKVILKPGQDIASSDRLKRVSDSKSYEVLAVVEDPAGDAMGKYAIVARDVQ